MLNQHYTRIGTYQIDAILAQFANGSKSSSGKSRPKLVFEGKTVKANSLRYLCFKHSGTVCIGCGLQATHFALEQENSDEMIANESESFHFNLYGLDANNDEIMFTKDHIIPISKGGKNNVSNLQTMCITCNAKKGAS